MTDQTPLVDFFNLRMAAILLAIVSKPSKIVCDLHNALVISNTDISNHFVEVSIIFYKLKNT